MIISFAFKENNSTISRSKVKRQEWEQQNALKEKCERIKARCDSQETQDTQEAQNTAAAKKAWQRRWKQRRYGCQNFK